jgi:CDP-diacylglycerol---serine O-phosphatidyltransferase
MIRDFHLADLFTLGNAAAGVGSIFASLSYVAAGRRTDFLLAAALLPVALVLDVLDGRIARWRQRHSAMGRELDSLADVISFGVGPAVLAYVAGLSGAWDRAVLIYFVCCGVSRLARFNVTAEALATEADPDNTSGKVAYFEGTPIPTSVALVVLLGVLALMERLGPALPGGAFTLAGGTFHPLVALFAVSGSLMISKTIRIPKL